MDPTAADTETALTNLRSALASQTARLAELDALPLVERNTLDFGEQGRSVSFSQYRASLVAQIKDHKAMVESVLDAGRLEAGPWTMISVVR